VVGLGVYAQETTHSGAIRPGLAAREVEVRSRLPSRQQACGCDGAVAKEDRTATVGDVESRETRQQRQRYELAVIHVHAVQREAAERQAAKQRAHIQQRRVLIVVVHEAGLGKLHRILP
jgi:hypothetical protein